MEDWLLIDLILEYVRKKIPLSLNCGLDLIAEVSIVNGK